MKRFILLILVVSLLFMPIAIAQDIELDGFTQRYVVGLQIVSGGKTNIIYIETTKQMIKQFTSKTNYPLTIVVGGKSFTSKIANIKVGVKDQTIVLEVKQ